MYYPTYPESASYEQILNNVNESIILEKLEKREDIAKKAKRKEIKDVFSDW